MANIYRIQWVGEDQTGAANITGVHVQTDVPTGGDEPDVGDVLDGFDTQYTFAFTSCLPDTLTVSELQLRQIVPPGSGDVPLAASKTLSTNGGLSGENDDVPTSCCVILSLHTNAALRSGRGYQALPSPVYSELMASIDRVGSTIVDNGAHLADLYADGYDLGSLFPTHVNTVVYSRARAGRLLDPVTFKIVSGSVNTRIMWRRSRVSIP